MLSTTLPPALSLLVILGFIGLMFTVTLGIKLLSRKMSGWQTITERFPMRDAHFTGADFRKQNGVVGSIGSGRRGFVGIRLAQEGVCIYPSFARHNPCLIPWSAIRRVSVSDTSLLVAVDYERTFEFFLPAITLPTFQAKLSPQLFHRAVSPFEVAKKAILDGTQPRWMSAIAGQAVRLAEKQVEKEKQSRKERHDDVA